VPTLVCFGDSMTAKEVDTNGTMRFTSRVREQLEDWTVINAGVPFETTRAGLARFQEDVLSHKPDLVTILFGTFDSHGSKMIEVKEFKKNLTYMVKKLSPKRAILISPCLVREYGHMTRKNNELFQYADAVEQVALETGSYFINLWTMIESYGQSEVLKRDGIYFNEKGYRILSEAVIKKIKTISTNKSRKKIAK
jgi:isoamyl acetate esterase